MIRVRIVFYSTLLIVLLSGGCSWHDAATNCDINKGPCTKDTGTAEIIFDITPKPVKAMQELTFTVKIKGGSGADNLIITLGMPGMYMGGNKVIARKSAQDTYTGKGIIPRCLSGKSLWLATVETPEDEKAGFLFNVIY